MKQGQYNRGGNYYSGQGGGGGPMTDINQAQGVHLGPGNHQHLHQQGGPAMGTANVQQQMPTMTHQQSAPFQQMTVGPHVNHQQHQHTGHGSHMGHPSGQRIGYATNPNRVPNPRHTSLMSQPRQPVQSSAGLPAQPMLQGFIPQYPQPHMVNAPVISYARQPHYYAAHSNHAVPYNQPYMIHPNQKRERKGAVILDPDTLKIVTESELLDQTTIKEPPPDTPSNRVLSSEALKFRNKIASVALTASGETGVPADALNVGENSGNTTTKTLEHVEDVNGTSVNDDKSVPSVTSSMQTNVGSLHEINTSTPSETVNNVQEAAVVEASKTTTISKPNQVVTKTASTSSTVNMTSTRVPTSVDDDQVDFFKLWFDAPEDRSIYENLHYDEIIAIISDFVESKNFLRATNQIKSLADTPKMLHFVDIALCMLLKNGYGNKFSVPIKVGELFAWLINERILKYATLYPRFHKFLQQQALFETKFKHFLKTVTKFLTSLLIFMDPDEKKYLFFGLLGPFRKSGAAQKLMTLTMKRVTELCSPEFATELWVSEGFLWSDFLQPGINEREFLEENKLDFLTSSKVEPVLDIEQEFKSILCAYLDHHDLERCRLQLKPLATSKNSADKFARCAIRISIEFGIVFYQQIGKLLSHLIAFGLVTEKQKLEALKLIPQLLLGNKQGAIVEKNFIKKAITSFMVNSEAKATALWASQNMKKYYNLDKESILC